MFKFPEKCLLSYIEINNGGCSEIDVYVGIKRGSHNLVRIVEGKRLARGRLNEVKIGHVPSVYVKLVVKAGKPMSIYQIRFNGIEANTVGVRMGPSTEYLLYKATERILFGKSLRTVRPVAKSRHDKMEKVGGDLPDKSYSYLTDIATPASIEISNDRGLAAEGVNIVARKLDEILKAQLEHAIERSFDRDAILPIGVGGRVAKKKKREIAAEGEVKIMGKVA